MTFHLSCAESLFLIAPNDLFLSRNSFFFTTNTEKKKFKRPRGIYKVLFFTWKLLEIS